MAICVDKTRTCLYKIAGILISGIAERSVDGTIGSRCWVRLRWTFIYRLPIAVDLL